MPAAPRRRPSEEGWGPSCARRSFPSPPPLAYSRPMNTPSRLYTDETEPFPVAAPPVVGRGTRTSALPRDQWRALGVLAFTLGVLLTTALWRLLGYHVLPSDARSFVVLINGIGDTSRVLDFVGPGALLVGAIVCTAGAPSVRARALGVAGVLLAVLSASALIWAQLVRRSILSSGRIEDADRSLLAAVYLVSEVGGALAVLLLVLSAAAYPARASGFARDVLRALPVPLGLLAPIASYALSLRTWDDAETRAGVIADVVLFALPVAALIAAVHLVRDAAWGGRRGAWPRRYDALGWILGALALSVAVAVVTAGFVIRAARAEAGLEGVMVSAQLGGLLVAPIYVVGLVGLVRGPRGTPVPTLIACSALFVVAGWVAGLVLARWGLSPEVLYARRGEDQLRTLLVVAPTLGYVGSLLFVGALAQVARRVGAYLGDAAASRTLTLMLASGAFVPLALWAVTRSFAAPITIMTGLAMLVLGGVVLVNLVSALSHTRTRILETERGDDGPSGLG